MFNAKIELIDSNEDYLIFSAKCPICGCINTLVLPNTKAVCNGLAKWKSGMLIQNAMPFLTPDQREFFITGNCPCIWGDDNDEEF